MWPVTKSDRLTKSFEGVPTPMDCLWQDANAVRAGPEIPGVDTEADWLAGCLLVPRDGLLATCRRSADQRYLAMRFGVSRDMIAWRLRMTGVSTQLKRENRLRMAANG